MVAPDEAPPGEQAFHRRIWRHRVGTPTDADVLIDGPGLYRQDANSAAAAFGSTPTTASTSDDGRWLLVTANVGTARRDSVWIADLHGDGALVPVLTQADDVRCHPWVERDGRLYLLTTDGAPRFRLAVADLATPGRENWRELVAEDPTRCSTASHGCSPADSTTWRTPARARPQPSRRRRGGAARPRRDAARRRRPARPRLLRGLTTADAATPEQRGRLDRVDGPGHPPAGAPL